MASVDVKPNVSFPDYTKEQRALFDELDPVSVCFLQLVGKEYPLKTVRTLEKKKSIPLQTEPTWEHKALSGTDSVICVTCNVYPMGKPEKGAYQP